MFSLVPRRIQLHDPWTTATTRVPHCTFTNRDVAEGLTLLEDLFSPLLISAMATNPTKRQMKRKDESDKVAPVDPKKARFEVKMNVKGYKPEELDVKLVNNCLVVKGSHESSAEGGEGYESCQFTRKWTIPDDVQLEELRCNFNSKDSTMSISAPRKVELQAKEKVIPITLSPKDDGVADSNPTPVSIEVGGSQENSDSVPSNSDAPENLKTTSEPTTAA